MLQITVRAQFNYEADDDPFIPCVELGISFKIGNVLHIKNRDDPHWWQVRFHLITVCILHFTDNID